MSKAVKILLAEKDALDAAFIRTCLEKAGMSLNMRIVSDEDSFMQAVANDTFDIILADDGLQGLTCLDMLRISKQQNREVPFIIISRAISHDMIVTAIKEGADDCLLKGNLERLPAAIKNGIEGGERSREKEFTHKQLIEKNLLERKRIEDKLKAKIFELDAFIYRTAHDLRGPLTSILGLVAIAKKELKDEMAQLFLDKFDKTAVRLDNILNDLVSVTKITRGETNFTKIHLDTLIPALIKRLDNKADRYGVKFSLDLPHRQNFLSDRYLIRSILQNILENSIRYRNHDAENTVISVMAKHLDKTIHIEISDNGQGIPDDIKDKIFDMFYKGNYASTGSGLGLYITRVAVEKLGGTISVSSNYGKGTTVSIYLPSLSEAQVEKLFEEQQLS